MLPQRLEQLPKMINMLLCAAAVYQDIVEVHHDEHGHEGAQHLCHKPHECAGGIG